MAGFPKVWCALLLQTTWNKTKVLFGGFILLFILWFRHHAIFFFLAGFLYFVSGQSCSGSSIGMTPLCLHVGHDHACTLVCFFLGKARGNLPTVSVVFLAESEKTSGRWVYLGRMVRRNDEPSSFCSVLSVQLHHLPLLNCKWEFGITYYLFLVH